jgi:hypothetical protein
MNIYTFPFSPFKLQNRSIITLHFLTLNMIKFGMNFEVCNVFLSFHVHIEQNVMDSGYLSLGVEQGCPNVYAKWPQHLLRFSRRAEIVNIPLRRYYLTNQIIVKFVMRYTWYMYMVYVYVRICTYIIYKYGSWPHNTF